LLGFVGLLRGYQAVVAGEISAFVYPLTGSFGGEVVLVWHSERPFSGMEGWEILATRDLFVLNSGGLDGGVIEIVFELATRGTFELVTREHWASRATKGDSASWTEKHSISRANEATDSATAN
jgi:hypothetical protein